MNNGNIVFHKINDRTICIEGYILHFINGRYDCYICPIRAVIHYCIDQLHDQLFHIYQYHYEFSFNINQIITHNALIDINKYNRMIKGFNQFANKLERPVDLREMSRKSMHIIKGDPLELLNDGVYVIEPDHIYHRGIMIACLS